MHSAITIRPARACDIPVLCGLLHALFSIESDFTPDQEKQARALGLFIDGDGDRTAVFVAEEGRSVIGMCSVQTVISTAEGGLAALMEDLIVHQDFRGQGVGTRLLSEVHAWCSFRGVTRIQLLIDQDNHPAEQFYRNRFWSATRLSCMRMVL